MMRISDIAKVSIIGLAAICATADLPDREAFATQKRQLDQVPVSAFELDPELGKDLKIEVWAQSPQVFTPVAIDVDAQGRVWSTEGIDYSSPRRISNGQSIVVMTDTDQDGRADKSHVFVSEPKARHAPMGLAVFDNKIVFSATPDIIVYTDVNRNAVFEPGIDKREVFLTGFAGGKHDHTLHAVVGSPSGQWYFSIGNMGMDVKTRDNRHLLAGCYYGNSGVLGKKSSDGHIWVGGVGMRVNPDGTGLTPVHHNTRNTHDMAVNSFGDVFHSDNDDPAHCRSTWLMEYGNLGYSDLRDGRRSWEEVAKSWEEPKGFGKGKRYSASHWRQNYPGALPPGTVYGAGSPLGGTFCESDALGPQLTGVFLSCDMVRKEIMAYKPVLKGAQIEMGESRPLVGLKSDQKKQRFLPSDVAVATDGSIFFSDFHNDSSRRTNQVSGTIYRISRKDATSTKLPQIDYESLDGCVAALQNPARNVRCEAVRRLKERGDSAAAKLIALQKTAKNPYVAVRPVWVLAQLGDKGIAYVEGLLRASDEQTRIAAFRALRHAQPDGVVARAGKMAKDISPAVRREVILALRDKSYAATKPILGELIAGYDGKNRWYLEAIGAAAVGNEAAIYADLVKPTYAKVPYAKWNDAAKFLAWRLHVRESIDDLHEVLKAQKMEIEAFRSLVTAYATFANEEERAYRKAKLESLTKEPAYAGEAYQLTMAEYISKDLNALKGEGLTASFPMPKKLGATTRLSDAKTIAALKPNVVNGKAKAGICLMCHKIGTDGSAFGPQLTHWGQNRTIEQIALDMLYPDAHLAHGFDKPVRLTKGKLVAEGFLANYSWHAGSLKIKLFGGTVKKILFRKKGVKVEELKHHSWMPPASEMGLVDQDVRDISEYLKTLK